MAPGWSIREIKRNHLSVFQTRIPRIIWCSPRVDSGGKNQAKAPFLITPPLFRLDAKEDNVLRVVRTGGNLPEDRESLYWLNIKAIPSSKHVEGVNTLQIAINTRIKLLYRPSAVKGRPEDVADKLEWHREGNDFVVNNPTPFFMNFQTVTLNGQKVKKPPGCAEN